MLHILITWQSNYLLLLGANAACWARQSRVVGSFEYKPKLIQTLTLPLSQLNPLMLFDASMGADLSLLAADMKRLWLAAKEQK